MLQPLILSIENLDFYFGKKRILVTIVKSAFHTHYQIKHNAWHYEEFPIRH